MIAETPMNMASTRSHCIFTVHVASRERASAVVRRAKVIARFFSSLFFLLFA